MIPKLLLLLLFISPSALCQQRALYWRDFTVNARLDSAGRLHVEERQSMVFSGDWNGGERAFQIPLGQELKLDRIARIDPATGQERDLAPGNLSLVDQYKWADNNILRWRSRLPDDPPFQKTEITYVIRYTLSNILVPENSGHYLLDHDFAFPTRSGSIQNFSLALTLDPAWNPMNQWVSPENIGPLPPGQGYVVRLPLRYMGSGKPAGVRFAVALWIRCLFLIAVSAAIAFLLAVFFRRQKSLGRFEPLTPVSSINSSWVKDNVLQFPPELVGTLWDESVGSAEVAAVLARLVLEGKLQSEVIRGKSKRSDVLHLRLLNRSGLSGYELDLVNALFFDGGIETDTDRVKEHYRNSGFDPSSKIRAPLEERMKAVLGQSGTEPAPSWKPTLVLTVIGIVLVGIACFTGMADLVTALAGTAVIAVPYIISKIMAMSWRKRLVSQLPYFIGLITPMAFAFLLLLMLLTFGALKTGATVLAGLCIMVIAAFNSVLNAARSRENSMQIAFRKKFASAREFFRTQLSTPRPELEDSWYPYLLAFGLGESVDRWFHSYSGGSAVPLGVGNSSTLPPAGGGGSKGWTGGGGAFGGAGASASWAAAAGSIAAGVAAPSSGSGGGGGGGHSGGGGGGGW